MPGPDSFRYPIGGFANDLDQPRQRQVEQPIRIKITSGFTEADAQRFLSLRQNLPQGDLCVTLAHRPELLRLRPTDGCRG